MRYAVAVNLVFYAKYQNIAIYIESLEDLFVFICLRVCNIFYTLVLWSLNLSINSIIFYAFLHKGGESFGIRW